LVYWNEEEKEKVETFVVFPLTRTMVVFEHVVVVVIVVLAKVQTRMMMILEV
jgi:L-amino acid N-acyltransferase YncA